MGTWSGWENQFCNRAGILGTPPNFRLLDMWAAHATHPNCKNNPIDLSINLSGSTRCAGNTGIHASTYTYADHAHAATAFRTEIHQTWAKGLLSAMNTGNPFQLTRAQESGVISVFYSWGSVGMANAYDAAVGYSSGGSKTGIAPDTLHGWHSLRRSLNRNWRKSLHDGERNLNAALRAISHSHKVHR